MPKINFKLLNRKSKSNILISCEHASNDIPKRYGLLGLEKKEFLKVSHNHDIGAKDIARIISDSLNARCLLANYCRLIIDLNRDLKNPTLIIKDSFGIKIPFNQNISSKEKSLRIDNYYIPYHRSLKQGVDDIKKQEKGYYISIHSFNHWINDKERKIDIGILYAFKKDEKFAKYIKKELEATTDFNIKFNEPYSAMKGSAFCTNKYGKNNNIKAIEFEINDKHLKSKKSIKKIGNLLSAVLKKAANKF